MAIQFSTDNKTWNSIGLGYIVAKPSGTAANPVTQYLQFRSVEARYVKLILSKLGSSYCYAGLSELNIYV